MDRKETLSDVEHLCTDQIIIRKSIHMYILYIIYGKMLEGENFVAYVYVHVLANCEFFSRFSP